MPRQRLKTYTHSLALNGTASVAFGKPAALQAAGGYVAYFAKIYQTSRAGVQALHTRGRSAVNYDYGFIVSATGQLGYRNNGADTFSTVAGAQIPLNQWTRVAFVVGGAHTYVFVDGLLVQDLGNLAVGTYATDIVNVTGARPLAGTTVDQNFNGYVVDEALIMSNLTAAQVLQYTTDREALKAAATAFWGYQNSLNDSSVNAINGTGTNTSFATSVIPPVRAAIPTGVSVIADGDMEAAGVASWPTNSATATKQTASPYKGTQYLRLTMTGAGSFAYQGALTVGKRYRITGRYRGDGTAKPIAWVGGSAARAEGTASTDWQYFDVSGVTTNIYFYLGSNDLSGYVEFDDVRVFDLSATPVRSMVAQRQNLLAYSYDLSAAPWTTDGLTREYPVGGQVTPEGKTRVTKLTENNAVGARHRLMYLSLPTVANRGAGKYTMSGRFKVGGGDHGRFIALYMQDVASSQAIFDLQSGVVMSNSANTVAKIVPDDNGYYRCILTVYNSTVIGNIQVYMSNGTQIIYNGDGASYVYAADVQLAFANHAGPVVDTNGNAVFEGELHNYNEPKQNLLTYSEDFTNGAWTKQAGVAVTGNQADPFGSNKACLLDLTAAGGTTGIYQSGGVPGRVHTFSVWMRTVSGTGDILLREGGGVQAVKSLTTAWTRHEFTIPLLATGPLWCIQKANANAANQVLIYGAQLNQGNWAGPYQTTVAAKVDYGAIRNLATI